MASDGIYRKTEKGRTEIATRANRLGLRERTMLIMVDDKTSRAGLLAKNSHPTSEGILNNLLADGYIEFAGGSESAAAPMAPAAAQPGVEVSLTSASRRNRMRTSRLCLRSWCRTLIAKRLVEMRVCCAS